MKSNSKETNRIKEPSKFSVKFANTVFVLGILFSVLVAVYAVYKIYNKPEYITLKFYFSFILFAVLSTALFVLGLRKLRDELKVNMSVLLITVGISVYGFETYLEVYSLIAYNHQEKTEYRTAIAEQMGITYDNRSPMEVLENLKASGINAYANVFPTVFIESNGLKTVKGMILPLGGISNISTILSNESGYYPIIETDEHGFNNPKGLYEINNTDIVLTGDSFTEGYSVHADETISAVLRESGFNAISVGKIDNGPLLELAALKEYAEPLKAKVVLWMYYINDLTDLFREMKSSFLQKYLNDNEFSQNLISRQEEIDSLLVDYVQGEWVKKRERERERERKMEMEIINIILIRNLRYKIKLKPTVHPLIFKDIMQKAKQMVLDWGGNMYFIYLPHHRYSTGVEDINREFVLHTANELEIPIIDIHKEVFVPHPDPLSLIAFKNYGHYTIEGYRLVAETISNRLKVDGIIPSNSKN